MEPFVLEDRSRATLLALGGGVLFALGVSLAIFGVLSLLQRTGEKGDKVARSVRFILAEPPAEVEKPLPPKREEVKPPKRRQRRPKAQQNKTRRIQRAVRKPRLAKSGIPRSFVGLGVSEAPTFVMAADVDLAVDDTETQAYANAAKLFRTAGARESAGRRGSGGGGTGRQGGVTPARVIEIFFPSEAYPANMLNKGVECEVVCRVVVSVEGLAKEVIVEEMQPHPHRGCTGNLDSYRDVVQQTLQTVSRHWKFRAAVDRENDLPVEDEVLVSVTFEIES